MTTKADSKNTVPPSNGEFHLQIPNYESGRTKGNRGSCRPVEKKNIKAGKSSHEGGRDTFENMIITCSNSFNSFDEITLGEEFNHMKEACKPAEIHVDLSECFEESRSSPRRTTSAASRPSSTLVRVSPRRALSTNSTSRLQTDAGTGNFFIWKKGPNNRYIKVPINGPTETNDGSLHEGSTASTQSCSNVSSARLDLDRLEEKLVEEALNRSMAESLTENELVELALNRSLQNQSSGSDPASDDIDANTDFVWRKRPNNAYYKCPSTRLLGEVTEGEEDGEN